MPASLRDRFLSVYGRMPVLEALLDQTVPVAKVFMAHNAEGESIAEILHEAQRRRINLERVKPEMVSAVAHTSRHQGVAADVTAPAMSNLGSFLERRRGGRNHATAALLLDRVHNPSNVGMILRSATAAASVAGIIVPRRGTAELGPLVERDLRARACSDQQRRRTQCIPQRRIHRCLL